MFIPAAPWAQFFQRAGTWSRLERRNPRLNPVPLAKGKASFDDFKPLSLVRSRSLELWAGVDTDPEPQTLKRQVDAGNVVASNNETAARVQGPGGA